MSLEEKASDVFGDEVERLAREIFDHCIAEETRRRGEVIQHGGYEVMTDGAKEHYRSMARWYLTRVHSKD